LSCRQVTCLTNQSLKAKAAQNTHFNPGSSPTTIDQIGR
jgi:hypothetical protein